MPTVPPPPPSAVDRTQTPPTYPAPVRWHWGSALAGALVTAILLGGVAFVWRRPTPAPIAIHPPPTVVIPTVGVPALAVPTSIVAPTPAPVVIFVAGAVLVPGVYELPAGARVVDALQRAGGFTPDANINVVNQAAPLADGDQIFVPTVAEDPAEPPVGISTVAAPPPPTIAAASGGAVSGSASGGMVNVNTASLEELIALPGIGETRAQAIIDNRPYASVDDLDRVPGIGPATLEDLRPLVVVQ